MMSDRSRRARNGFHFSPIQTAKYHPWMVAKGAFPAALCDQAIRLGEERPANAAVVLGDDGKTATHGSRSTDVRFLGWNESTSEIFDRVAEVFIAANDDYFGFDLVRFSLVQIGIYRPGDKYDWHTDIGNGRISTRKLSVSVMLSESRMYEGGRFQVMTNDKPTDLPLERGDAVVFPSYVVHRVEPVTSGTRFSLVAWADGPTFR